MHCSLEQYKYCVFGSIGKRESCLLHNRSILPYINTPYVISQGNYGFCLFTHLGWSLVHNPFVEGSVYLNRLKIFSQNKTKFKSQNTRNTYLDLRYMYIKINFMYQVIMYKLRYFITSTYELPYLSAWNPMMKVLKWFVEFRLEVWKTFIHNPRPTYWAVLNTLTIEIKRKKLKSPSSFYIKRNHPSTYYQY